MKHGEAAELILNAAEAMVRKRGYNGVSFRDIAKAVGIKSASVHYHFPTKDDLALALAERYSARFLEAARSEIVNATSIPAKISAYGRLFRQALEDDGKMCLCGMFAAEADGLSDAVRETVQKFFAANLTVLEDAFREFPAGSKHPGDAAAFARIVVAGLEGAMLMARAEGSIRPIDQMIEDLVARYAD